MRGNGWQTFGVVLVLAVLVEVVAAIVDVAAESASTGAGIVVRVVLGVLIGPLSALAAAVLYFELRRLHGSPATDSGMATGGVVESDFDSSSDPPTPA